MRPPPAKGPSTAFSWRWLLLTVFMWSTANAVLLPTPPMGWSTWESFGKDLSDDKILGNVAILENTGLKDKGYNMIQIDDGWMQMDRSTGWISRGNVTSRPLSTSKGLPLLGSGKSAGCMLADPNKFPDGMKVFGSKLKARGFGFGLYTSGEDTVCDSNPAFKGFYASTQRYGLRNTDASCFVDWDVDLMKIDMCNPPSRTYSYASRVMRAWRSLLPSNIIIYNSRYGCLAPVNCGRAALGGNPYVCPSAVNFVKNRRIQPYCAQTASLARVGVDMKPKWPNIMSGILARIGRGKISRPGFWSDPDYLVPHETLLTFKERRSQFSAWCIMSAPLFISVDLRSAGDLTLAMLGNPDAIRVNQQYHNDGGDVLRMQGVIYVFRKQLSPTEFAILALHVGSQFARYGPATDSDVTWSPGSLANLVPRSAAIPAKPSMCDVKSIWQSENGPSVLLSNTTFTIASHDCVFLLVSNCQ